MKSPSGSMDTKTGSVLEREFTSVESDLAALLDRPGPANWPGLSKAFVIAPRSARPRPWFYGLVLIAVATAGALLGAVADDLSSIGDRSNGPAASSTPLEPTVVQPLSASLPQQVAENKTDVSAADPPSAQAAVAAPRPSDRSPPAPRQRPPRREAQSARRAAANAASCAGLTGAAAQRCAYPKLLAADRRLRAAYEQAVQAKAPRQVLVSYQRRWSSLRRDSRRDPERVARAYDRLAGELRQAARERR